MKMLEKVNENRSVGECSVGSMLGVAALVVSLSNEAPWSHGSHPSLGPHTSLMFPHHSPDNYRGRECHPQSRLLNRGWQHKVCGLPDVSWVHPFCMRTHWGSLHTLTNISTLLKVNHMCPLIILTTHEMHDSSGSVPAHCSTFPHRQWKATLGNKGSVCPNKEKIKLNKTSSMSDSYNIWRV